MNETLQHVMELSRKRDALLRELERSIAIQTLWPEAFAHGAARSSWIGRPITRTLFDIRYALRLQVTDGAGTVREFPQDDVPAVLWPHAEKGRL
jgi:hypothetical protein